MSKGYFIYYDNAIVVKNLLSVGDAYVAVSVRVTQGHRNHPHFVYSEYGLVQEITSDVIEAMSK